MLGLVLVGLSGFLVVAVAVPLLLWALSMETLRGRAAPHPTPSTRLSLVPRGEPRVVATLSSAAA